MNNLVNQRININKVCTHLDRMDKNTTGRPNYNTFIQPSVYVYQ